MICKVGQPSSRIQAAMYILNTDTDTTYTALWTRPKSLQKTIRYKKLQSSLKPNKQWTKKKKSQAEDRTAGIQTYPRPRARMCEMSKEGIKTLRNSAEKMPPFFMTPLFRILRDTERRGCLKWNSLRGIINQQVNVKLLRYHALLLVKHSGFESLLTSVECFPACWTNQRPSLVLYWAGCLPLCPALDLLPLTADAQVAHLSF